MSDQLYQQHLIKSVKLRHKLIKGIRKPRLLLAAINSYAVNILGLVFLGLPVLTLTLLASSAIRIRYGYIYGAKLGHLAGNVELYLCEMDSGINTESGRTIDIFYIKHFRALNSPKVCNNFLLEKWRKKILIMPALLINPVYSLLCLLKLDQFRIMINETTADRDIYNLLDATSPHIVFDHYELKMARHILELIGIPSPSKFVCLNVRDSAYWPCHLMDGFRNSEIETYAMAACALEERGYHVVRMGAKVNKKISFSTSRIIDYSCSGYRSEIMDIYLGAFCFFAVSTGTGWDAVPYIFRKPICYVNAIPVGYAMTFCKKTVLLFKELINIETHKKLSLREILENERLMRALSDLDYEELNVNIIDNTAEQIEGAVVDMHNLLTCEVDMSEIDRKNQEMFMRIYSQKVEGSEFLHKLHGSINARCSASYMRSNPEWLA